MDNLEKKDLISENIDTSLTFLIILIENLEYLEQNCNSKTALYYEFDRLSKQMTTLTNECIDKLNTALDTLNTTEI